MPYLHESSRLEKSEELVRHFQTISVVFFVPAKFLNHEEPHVRPPSANPVSTAEMSFPEDGAFVRSYTRARTPRTRVNAHVPVCTPVCFFVLFLSVCGCEICGFSQSVLICVSLSLSQQIIVKYTHT